MTNVLVLGAGGRIARWAVPMLADEPSVRLTLLARHVDQLPEAPGANTVAGDVLDADVLADALSGQDLVYANLSGEIDVAAERIARAMENAGVGRLVFVTALGIYDEVPGAFGRWNRDQIGPVLGRYRAAADVIEASPLDWTILRPAWLSDADEVSFELTARDEPFRGTTVSRKSVAALVTQLVADPTTHVRASLGVNKPNTDGDRPVW